MNVNPDPVWSLGRVVRVVGKFAIMLWYGKENAGLAGFLSDRAGLNWYSYYSPGKGTP